MTVRNWSVKQVRRWSGSLTCILALCLLVSCASPTLIHPTPTATLAPSETPTPTVVWFPPTPTKTTVPKIELTPTLEMRPGVGEVIFEDDFSASGAWGLGQNSNGTVAMGVNELTIVIVQPKTYLFSTRTEPSSSNFYVEITASPNLCAGLDEYGLLFGSPQPWLVSASVPRGAPSRSRLGVWAVGRELRFFINDEFQFAVSDPYHSSGLFGVFARSAGENAVTISFSDLKVYQIGQ